LENLAIPTAFTYSAIYSVVSCSEVVIDSVETSYISQFFTAVVDGSLYQGENPMIFSTAITTPGVNFYTPITFPGLTVTVLTPGEAITMVCPYYDYQHSFQSWEEQGPDYYKTGTYQ
jgi:hypothetical protein